MYKVRIRMGKIEHYITTFLQKEYLMLKVLCILKREVLQI